MGFGWSFYGFFVAAVVWLLLYFVWARRAAVRDPRHPGTTEPRNLRARNP
jgi:hypothetical protein